MTDAVTVTANPALDHTVWVPGFRAGEVNRVVREQISPGGKGVNVAAFLTAAGVAVHATGFLGTPNASLFHSFFEQTGIGDGFVPVPGMTRTGIKIVDDDAGTTTDLNFPGFEVGPEEVEVLEAALTRAVVDGRWVVLAGSLPPGAPGDLWRRLAERAHDAGGLVALDSSGEAFAAGLQARPDLVKPNREELSQLLGRSLDGRAAVLEAARSLGVPFVIVSMGAEGALFARGDEAVFAVPGEVRVASTVGAGDAMVAGAVCAILRGLDLAETARLATAFSKVAIATVGPHLDEDAVQLAMRDVVIEEVQ